MDESFFDELANILKDYVSDRDIDSMAIDLFELFEFHGVDVQGKLLHMVEGYL